MENTFTHVEVLINERLCTTENFIKIRLTGVALLPLRGFDCRTKFLSWCMNLKMG